MADLTLRQHYAGQALAGLLANTEVTKSLIVEGTGISSEDASALAQLALFIAAAMEEEEG